MARTTYTATLPAVYNWPQIVALTRSALPAPIDITQREAGGQQIVLVLHEGSVAGPTVLAWQDQVAGHVPADEPPANDVDPAAVTAALRAIANAIDDPTNATNVATLRGEVNSTKVDIAIALIELAGAVDKLAGN